MRTPKFWNLTTGAAPELRIDGEIVDDANAWICEWLNEPHTSPGSMRAQLNALGNAPLTVWIDSPGGSVDAAAAIYTALREYPGETTAKIEARAYSAASVIAMACNRVLISPVAMMMVHLPWTYAGGNEHDLRHTADVLAECGETLLNAYEIKTGKPREELRAMLRNETWMSARRAVEMGFADGLLYEWGSDEAEASAVAGARRIYAALRQNQNKDAAHDWTADAEIALAIERARN